MPAKIRVRSTTIHVKGKSQSQVRPTLIFEAIDCAKGSKSVGPLHFYYLHCHFDFVVLIKYLARSKQLRESLAPSIPGALLLTITSTQHTQHKDFTTVLQPIAHKFTRLVYTPLTMSSEAKWLAVRKARLAAAKSQVSSVSKHVQELEEIIAEQEEIIAKIRKNALSQLKMAQEEAKEAEAMLKDTEKRYNHT